MAALEPQTPWSGEFLAFVLPLTPEAVLRQEGRGGATPESREEWAWISFAQRQVWMHGESEGLARVNAAIATRWPQSMERAA